jgi:hypothetical protein
MKKSLVFAVMIIITQMFSGISFAKIGDSEHQKSSWYIGFGLGSGRGYIEGDSFQDLFDKIGPDAETSPTIFFNFGVGGILTPQWHLGFDITAIRQQATYELYRQSADASFQINNYLLAATFYPMNEGFFLRGGIGLSAFQFTLTGDVEDEISESYSGTGFLIGTGYDFWLGKTFNLGIHADYSKQSYSDSEAPDDTNFFAIYVSFYWL